MNFVRSNILSLKYERFTTTGWKDVKIRKFQFVSNNQFLWVRSLLI